jgi:hypothetical protein
VRSRSYTVVAWSLDAVHLEARTLVHTASSAAVVMAAKDLSEGRPVTASLRKRTERERERERERELILWLARTRMIPVYSSHA